MLDCIEKFNQKGRIFHWAKTAEAIMYSLNNLTAHQA
jgi:hypothetical protein